MNTQRIRCTRPFSTWMIVASLIWLVGAFTPTSMAASERANGREADLIIHNAAIWTADPEQPAASVLVMANGILRSVTDNEENLDQFIGPRTRVIDADGRRILPGLIDTHVHLGGAADDFRHLMLRDTVSRDDLLQRVAAYAEEHDENDWIIGVRWSAESWPDQRPPSAEELDAAAGGRPVALTRMDGHMLVVSSRALEIAGINADGPDDPPGGRIGRRDDGTPTGEIFEQAMRLVRQHIPADSGEEDFDVLFDRALREANRVGLTQVGAIEPRSIIEEYLMPRDERGDLPLRVAATVRTGSDRVRAWENTFVWAAEQQHQPGNLVRVIGFKGFMDGTLGSRTAWLFDPFNDNPDDPENAGFPLALAGSGALGDLIRLGANEHNLQPAVHAIGDKANHTLLNWYEQLDADRRASLRPRIEHAQHLHPDDIARFAELGVVPSMQPLHKADDGRYAEQRLGSQRIQTSYAYRNLLDSGARLAFGSDWPVVSVNPFRGIEAAVTAKTIESETFLPEQSITAREALIAYTRDAAYCLHSEDHTGMLREGFAADFIMIDQDILAIEPVEIGNTRVLLTVVNGRVVHQVDEGRR